MDRETFIAHLLLQDFQVPTFLFLDSKSGFNTYIKRIHGGTSRIIVVNFDDYQSTIRVQGTYENPILCDTYASAFEQVCKKIEKELADG